MVVSFTDKISLENGWPQLINPLLPEFFRSFSGHNLR